MENHTVQQGHMRFTQRLFGLMLGWLAILISALTQTALAAPPTVEIFSGSSAASNGPTATTQTHTFQLNANNPSDNANTTFTPTITVTYNIASTYNASTYPTGSGNTRPDLTFGGTVTTNSSTMTATGVFQSLNGIGSPTDNMFAATLQNAPTGCSNGSACSSTNGGISVTSNYGLGVFSAVRGLKNAGISTSASTRTKVGTITATFNRPVTNPILQIAGLGAEAGTGLGVTAEFDLVSSSSLAGVAISRLAGSRELSVSGSSIRNNASTVTSTSGSGGASGSVYLQGRRITSLTFDVFMRGDGASSSWETTGTTAGDLFFFGISSIEADNDISIVKSQRVGNSGSFVQTQLSSVPQNSLLQYQLLITNSATNGALNSPFSDAIPSSLTNVSIVSTNTTGTGTACSPSLSGNNLTGTFTGPSGATCTIIIQGTAGTLGTVSNSATILENATDPDINNNTTVVNAIVVAPTAVTPDATINEARFTITPDLPTIVRGRTGTQIVTIKNEGPNAATATVATFIPAPQTGVTVTGVSVVSGSACTLSGGQWSCPVGGVANGATFQLSVQYSTTSASSLGVAQQATIKVSSNEFNPGSGVGETLYKVWGSNQQNEYRPNGAFWVGYTGTGGTAQSGSFTDESTSITSAWPAAQSSPTGGYLVLGGNSTRDSQYAASSTTASPMIQRVVTSMSSDPERTIQLALINTPDIGDNRRAWEFTTGIYITTPQTATVCMGNTSLGLDDSGYIMVDGSVVSSTNSYLSGGMSVSTSSALTVGYHRITYRIANRNTYSGNSERSPGGYGAIGLSLGGGCNTASYDSVTSAGVPASINIIDGARVKIAKNSVGATGTFNFNTLTNLANSTAAVTTDSVTTATAGVTATSAQQLWAQNLATAVSITEAATAGFVLSSASCTDANSGVTGNAGNFGALAGNVLTIPAANIKEGADISCTFTNNRTADLVISKTGPATVTAGQQITYSLKVWNKGSVGVTDAVVTDIVPNNVSGVYIRCAATGTATCGSFSNYVSGSNTRSATGVNLPVDVGGNTNYVTYTITGLAYSTGTFTNTATVSSSVTDENSADNTSSQTTTIPVTTPVTTGTAANQCTAAESTNIITPFPFTAYVNNSTTQTGAIAVNSSGTSYGTGTNGAIIMNGRLSWSYGSPAITGSTMTIYVNGTAYAVLTTVGASANPNQATWTALNGASITPSTVALGSYNNSATAVAFSLTLPTTVTSVTAAYVEFRNISPTGSAGVAGDDVGIAIDSIMQCQAPVVKIAKISNGATGTFNFNSLTNLSNASGTAVTTDTVTTSSTGVAATSSQTNYATARNTQVSMTEAAVANYVLNSASCTDANSAVTGNTGNFGTLAGNTLTIPAARIKYAANISCTFTNSKQRTLTVVKSLSPSTDSGQFIMNANGTTGTAGGDGATASAVVNVGSTVTFAETANAGTNAALYSTSYSCNTAPVTTGTGTSGSLTMPDANVTCTMTNTRKSASLTLRKVWAANSKAGDTVAVTSTGFSTNATSGNSVATAAGNTTTGTAVTVFAGESGTISEAFSVGSTGNYTGVLSCTGNAQAVSGNTLTIDPADTAITCTITNSRIAQQISLNKQWQNGATGHTISVTSTGGTNNPTLSSTSSGSNSTTGTAVTVYAGDSVTLPAESFGGGASAGQYNSTLACSGGTTLASGAVNRSITITNSTTATVCTYTNARVSNAIKLSKSWTNGKTGDAVSLSITGGSSAVAGSSSVGGTTTNATATGLAGDTISFAEAFTTGSGSNYNQTLSCSKDSDSSAITVSSNSISMPSDSAVTCTYTNSRIAQQISLSKQWQNGATGHTISVTSTGGTNNPTLSSTSSGSNSTTGTAVTVYAGDSVTLPAETFGGGASAVQYNSSLACSGGTTLASGAVNRSITITNSTTATVCTYSNARNSSTLTLRKTWVNAKLNDAATVTATGLTSLTSVADSANETDVGTAQTVYVGDVITLGETITTGSGNYNASLSCRKNSDNSLITVSSNSITMPSDSAVTCTYTNSRIAQQISLSKQWQNGATGHTISVTSTGGTNNPTLSSTSSGSNSTTGTAVTVYAGDSVTLPAETFGGGASALQYNSTLACSGGTTLASGAVNRSITITNSTTATVCTYSNARKSATLTLRKVWAANSKAGDTVTVTSTGFSANATSGNSVATAAGNTTTGTAVTVYAGESGTIGETFSVGSASNYNATLSCTGNSQPLSGNSLTIDPADTAIVCTQTNTRIAQQISLSKQWQFGGINHTANVTTTGGTNNPNFSSTSTGNNTTNGTAVTVYAGDNVTLPAETFGGGANASQYNTTLSCTGGSPLANGLVNRTLTISNSTTATVCSYVNARKGVTFTLVKQWQNGKTNDAATVSSTGFTNNTTTGVSVSTGNNSTTGVPATVYVGDVGTISETFSVGSASNYNATLSCTGNSIPLVGNTLTIGLLDTAITCTQTNSRIAQQISLNKQWQNGATGHTISVTSTGGTNNPTLSSTSSGSNSTTGTAVTVYAGDSVTLPAESFGGGASAGQYNSTLACSGGTTLASGAVNRSITITNSTTATVCTYINARVSNAIKLSKSWTNGKTGDAVSLSISGGSSAVAGSSTVGGTTTNATATGLAGNTISFAEAFTTGSGSNYNQTLSCSKDSDSSAITVSSNSISMPSDSAVTCTFNNSRIAQQISLNKQWQNGANGHTISVTSTGGTNNPTLSSTSSGSNSTTGTAVTVYAGDVVTLPAESFGGGASAGQYNSTLACSGGTNLASGAVNRSITITNSTTATVCTYSNARKSVALTLRKAWVNGIDGDTVTVSSTGFASNATTGASISTGNNTTTGSAVTVYAGESGSINEVFTTGSASNYNSALSCTGTSGLTGNTLIVGNSDSAIVCTYTNTRVQATIISGRVFNDNSGTTANASAAYNGVQDAGETGIAGSKVVLTNCAATQVASTITNAAGDYSFSISPAQLPAPSFCIVQTNVAAYSSVSGTAGYTRSTDTISVSNTGATVYNGHNFGDARLELVLTEDGQKTIGPGSVVDYPHRLIASSVMNVNNLAQSLTQQPASAADQPWSALVYRDANCNGVVDAGEAVFQPATTPLSMLPGQEICLVQRVNSPANASSGAQHIGRLQASYAVTLADSSQLTGSSNQRQDTTLIGSAGLTMHKQVRVVASCPSTGADNNPFATQNQASKGDYLEYEITYRNNSTRNLVDIVIKDSVPLGTSFQSIACTVTPMSSCTPVQSGDALSWQTTGLLPPAREGKVRFCTRVQ